MHNIAYRDYPENVNKKQVQAELDDYVRHETWQEGGHGCEPIRWLDQYLLDTRDEAESKIEALDRKWYDCLAVRYKAARKCAAIDRLNKRASELYDKYRKMEQRPHFADAKSEYIGCKSCGSKLNRVLLGKKNECPLCRKDLRPESTLSAIARAKKAYQEAEKKVEAAKKNAKLYDIRWLVKFEYHT